MAQIVINNRNFMGSSVSIINGKVIIDGKEETIDDKEINIRVDGNIDTLDVGYCNKLDIVGNINKARSGSGDINCLNITGGAQVGSGDIECETINGDVQTGSGDVKSNTITGSVRTGSGDIKYKK